VAVPSAESAESWKPFPNPEKYAALLPALWTQEGVTVYGVPKTGVVLAWRDLNHFSVRAAEAHASVAVSYRPGWHASVDGRPVDIQRDRFGLMRVQNAQPATIEFAYDGGPELRIAGWVSVAAILAAVWFLVRGGWR
jgi:hypothetical protein